MAVPEARLEILYNGIGNTTQIDTGQHLQSALALHKHAGMIAVGLNVDVHHQHKSKSMNQGYSDEDHYK